MTKKEQKAKERSFLDDFKLIYPDFPLGKIDESEGPDFLVLTEAETIGIEVTEYIRGQGGGGSSIRRDDMLRERIVSAVQAEFESRHQAPLEVNFVWYGHRHLRKTDVQNLVSSAAELIVKKIPRRTLENVRIGPDQLSGTSLGKFVAYVSIIRLRATAQGAWHSSETGWTEVGTDELQALISSKEEKIDSYLKKCASGWLLIVADRPHVSSAAELLDNVKRHSFQTRFERVFFYNRWNQSVITLVPTSQSVNQSNDRSQNIQGFLRVLYSELERGWRAFLVAKSVSQIRASNRVNSMHYFFSTVHNSCLSYAILALAKIFDKHKDAISIEYLLNYSEQNADAFPYARREDVSKSVPEYRSNLATVAPIIENIREQRGRIMAHLDKRLVKKPENVFAYPPLNLEEVESVFGLAFSIINNYCKYLGSEFARLDHSRRRVTGDFEYLVRLIEKDNARINH